MFGYCTNFNGTVNHWNTSSVNDMVGVFRGAENFNHPISNWDVASVVDFGGFFQGANSFDQELHHWAYTSGIGFSSFLNNTSLSIANYDSLLFYLETNYPNKNVFFGANNLVYCAAESARNQLISNGWSFMGGFT